MQVRIECKGSPLPVGQFVGRFGANICSSILASLNSPQSPHRICFDLNWRGLSPQDDSPVAMDPVFASTIVGNTLRGMVRELEGIDPAGNIRIETELESGQ